MTHQSGRSGYWRTSLHFLLRFRARDQKIESCQSGLSAGSCIDQAAVDQKLLKTQVHFENLNLPGFLPATQSRRIQDLMDDLVQY